jgi:hypothetical protein
MALLLVILLILLILTGSLLTVLKVALGVAVGLVLAVVVLGLLFAWWIRRKWRAAMAGASGTPPAARGTSTVEVLTPPRQAPRQPAGSIPPTVIDVTPIDDADDSAGPG